MKASLRFLALGLFLFVPFATASAQAPSLSVIPNVIVNAGSTATVSVIAVDVDGRPITLTSALPSFGILNTPTSGTGVVVTTLTFSPAAVNVGSYTAAVTATAGGVDDIEIFQITVNAAGSDRAPVVSAPPLREVTAGSNLNFTVNVSDADGDAIESLIASGLPTGATFTPNGSNTSGLFNWTPGLSDDGEYDVLFTATNSLVGAGVTHIRVASAPTLTITPIDDVTLADGSSLSVPVNAAGVVGAQITLTASLPSFATLNPPGTGTSAVNTTITVAPPIGSAGTYHASVTGTSLGASVTEEFDIIVTGTGGGENHAPVLSAPAAMTVAVGSTLSFDVTATDPDGDHVDLFGSALPPGSAFLDHADNTGTFTWSPISGQAGTYTASFSGLDNRGGSGAASTQITVTGGSAENHAPTLSAPSALSVDVGVNLSFTVTATDPDGDHVVLTSSPVPSGATFSDQGNNTGVFSWTPGSTQSGAYVVPFNGNDGHGGTGTASTAITVTEVAENHAPTLSAPSALSVDEGANLSFTVTATDQDGDHVVLSANSVPSGGTFSDQGDNTGVFSWTPSSTQSGVYNVTFAGNDGHGGTGTASTAITVRDVNGGGVDEIPGKACLIASFQSRDGTTCFRIRSVNGSFDLRDVVLSSITFVFHGSSVAALNDRTRIELHCHGGGHDAAINPGAGPHGDDDGDAEHRDCGGVVCGEHGGNENGNGGNGGNDGNGGKGGGGDCDTLGIRACFSTEGLLRVLGGAKMPCDLVNAEMHAALTSGGTVVATFGKDRPAHDGDDDADQGEDKGNDQGEDAGKDEVTQNGEKNGENSRDASGHRAMNPRVRPNPLNPMTELSFTTSREGMVRVAVYDMQGRLVKTLLGEFRAAGEQRLAWDGSNAQSQKVASGVYFFRVLTSEGGFTQRVAVVK